MITLCKQNKIHKHSYYSYIYEISKLLNVNVQETNQSAYTWTHAECGEGMRQACHNQLQLQIVPSKNLHFQKPKQK